jgi:uncharacterized protein YlxP (DUF503 family)
MTAVVGMARWVLHLPGCDSLKAKRKIVLGLRDRLQSRHRVSVAETDFQDKWQMAELSAALVASDMSVARRLMERLERQVDSDIRVRVVKREIIWY